MTTAAATTTTTTTTTRTARFVWSSTTATNEKDKKQHQKHPNSVVVTGTFDNWSQSQALKLQDDGGDVYVCIDNKFGKVFSLEVDFS
jgi:ABC-type glycerol-3-phosphate transport system substrate-binding protein